MTELANYWSGQYSVDLITLSLDTPFYDLRDSVKLSQIDFQSNSKLNLFKRRITLLKKVVELFRQVKRLRPDVIVTFGTSTNIIGVVFGKIIGRRVVISERSNPMLSSYSKAIIFLRKKIYKFADTIVLQTQETAEIFKRIKVSLPEVKVIQNPINSKFGSLPFAPSNTVIAVGRFSYVKDYESLLTIYSEARVEGWKLQIIGDGIGKSEIERMIKRLGLDDNVTLLGNVNDVYKHLSNSAIFIMTSRHEGFPNALCEAMISGCACISYDCSTGPKEIINNGTNGILIPERDIKLFSNSLQLLMNDEDLRLRLGTESKKMKSLLSTESIMEKWDSIL